jgi:hypothetical protein
VSASYSSNSKDLMSARRFEVDVAIHQPLAPSRSEHLLSPHELWRENIWIPILPTCKLLIEHPPTIHNNVQDIGSMINLMIRFRHDLVDNLCEKLDISSCISRNIDEKRRVVIVLHISPPLYYPCKTKTYLLDIIEINDDSGRLPICYFPQYPHVLCFTPLLPVDIQIINSIC